MNHDVPIPLPPGQIIVSITILEGGNAHFGVVYLEALFWQEVPKWFFDLYSSVCEGDVEGIRTLPLQHITSRYAVRQWVRLTDQASLEEPR